ncbi:hypothetical protein Lal_00047067 [Lupinus albus]|nr:hypothetical protein Lal_00047067 [Lupinus albus]
MLGMNKFQGGTISYERVVIFKECMRNHGALLGFVCRDGCLEFIGGGRRGDDDNKGDAMICATCSCHRNFHRKVIVSKPISKSNKPDNNINSVNANPSLVSRSRM